MDLVGAYETVAAAEEEGEVHKIRMERRRE